MIRVAIVDDSAVVRQQLSQLLTQAGLQVQFTASDPLFAWPKIKANPPDVLVLDVEMPRMDGISFLRQLMSEHPLPVVMCSTLTQAGAETTLQALAAGAVAFVTKPKIGLRDFLADDANGLIPAVKAAAAANLRALPKPQAPRAPAPTHPVQAPAPAAAMAETTDRIVAVGSSTGGVQTFENFLQGLPNTLPAGIVWVQHMPPGFTASLAERLTRVSGFDVIEAKDGDRVLAGRVLIAPGGKHMQLTRSGAQYRVEVKDGPLVNHHKPSVDVLFRSVARCAGRNALGVILTGMGDDGARGLLEMRKAGAYTVAQDEASCVVYGMPKAAFEMGAAVQSLPLGAIGSAVVERLQAVNATPSGTP
ncbi:protein-glutamate methylesterase/protein-glutamine glutaminase [Inhella gelatinilytica]|uniref:Protein-glutamate methylesterase/protein-glutamine glutaminase n=1 Tax=Inhella gelatinilytica TaxID=2795030 RepID=A0A931ND26_9BURK|nr:chemotaxis response regulator protein-glutamate methylesterase [Inhella gelatinilytica]MBH9552154.1 chemotaxis response regulator protein-glutamate methylesterase [Inhella gelatinilytica]